MRCRLAAKLPNIIRDELKAALRAWNGITARAEWYGVVEVVRVRVEIVVFEVVNDRMAAFGALEEFEVSMGATASLDNGGVTESVWGESDHLENIAAKQLPEECDHRTNHLKIVATPNDGSA